ncbi:MAG: winged helix-turn-helix domain-containing protein [Acidimicrobiales bacterium]
MPRRDSIPIREARWLALAAQGLATNRPATTGPSRVRRVMQTVGTIQLDAVNVLARTQMLVPFARLGSYDPAAFAAQSGPGRAWFEYWGHAASLLPTDQHHLFRWRMQLSRDDLLSGPGYHDRQRAWREAHAEYLAAVLAQVGERGPLAASQLSDPRRRTGEWWDRRSVGREALERLFSDGVVTAWRSPSFERVYDLTERVIDPEVLARPAPPAEEARSELLLLAARCLGVATLNDLADYFWMRPVSARPLVRELVAAGRLLEVEVEGWAAPAYILPGAGRPRPPRRQEVTLLSPFDSLIWFRERTQRLFGFHYRIEIYVPAPKRVHGYYVLPVLAGDELVGRLDLKADRANSTLRVVAAHAEPGLDGSAIAPLVVAELDRMRLWLGLADLAIGRRGDLAAALAAASG